MWQLRESGWQRSSSTRIGCWVVQHSKGAWQKWRKPMASKAQKQHAKELRKRRKLRTKKTLDEALKTAARVSGLETKTASDDAIIAKQHLDLTSAHRELGSCQQQLARRTAALETEHDAHMKADTEAKKEAARVNELQDRLGKALKTIEQLQAQDIDAKSLRERLRKRGDEIAKLQTLLAQEKGKVEELRSSKINFDRTTPPVSTG